MRTFHFPYQARIILGFAAICLLIGLLSLSVGISIINRTVFTEAANRVSQDLNSAWDIFLTPLNRAVPVFTLTAEGGDFADDDEQDIIRELQRIQDVLDLSFVSLVLPEAGNLRLSASGAIDENTDFNKTFIQQALDRRVPVSGITVLDRDFLMTEDPSLAEQARIPVVPTPRAEVSEGGTETSAMVIVLAYPVLSSGVVRAILYGGVLLSKNNDIVDKIRDTVFRLETYRGVQIGTATIFFNDVRVATNVVDATGQRAIGTQVSQEVKETVLDYGIRWTDRAFVVENWYITAYDPIEDIDGNRVGMLYVGVLESKYRDFRRSSLTLFILIIAGGLVVAIVLGFLLSRLFLRPINRLIAASRMVSEGHLSPEIGRISRDEIGVLQKTFLTMLQSFQERVRRQESDSAERLLQSEKQASVGRLAAGVAHEINNPLTSVLTFTHLLLERNDLPEDAIADLKVISDSTERVRRIVRGLLDYSRPHELHTVPTDLNSLIEASIQLLGNQVRGPQRALRFEPAPSLPASR